MRSGLSGMRAAKLVFRVIAASIGLVLALFLAGCSGSEAVDQKGETQSLWSEGGRRLWRRPSATSQVLPSAQDQRLTVLGVGITVPGALLGTAQTLSVTARPDFNLTKPMPEMQTIGVYDIAMGSLNSFDKPLVLEFPYDAAALGDGAAEGKNLWVSYWDEARQVWGRMDAQVDVARQKIVVKTGHLSTWWIYRLRGYDYVPKEYTGYFEVYFNPNHVNPRTDVTGHSMKDLALDVLSAMETARENYKSAGFKVPTVRTSVFIADVADSEWGALGGAIDLKRSDLVNLDRLRSDAAHELFHAIQNQYYFTGLNYMPGGMIGRMWLIEGSPDFMAWRYGWNRSIAEQIDFLDLSWFEASLFENSDLYHAYQTGNFLRYLDQVAGVDTKKLWDYVVAWWANTPEAFRSGIFAQANRSFEDIWRDFIEQTMFGPTGLAKAPKHQIRLNKNQTNAAATYDLSPNYTAKLVKISADACSPGTQRKIKIGTTTSFTGSSQIRLWTATDFGVNPVYLRSLTAAGQQTADIEVDDTTRVFAIAYNTQVVSVADPLGSDTIAANLTVTANDCSESLGFSRSYSALELYNRDIIGDLTVSVSGPYSSYQEFALPGMVFLKFKVPTPAAGKTISYGLSAGISGLKCNGCAIQSYSWNEFGTGTGDSTVVVIDETKCGGRADFYVKFANRSTGALPLSVDINGCP